MDKTSRKKRLERLEKLLSLQRQLRLRDQNRLSVLRLHQSRLDEAASQAIEFYGIQSESTAICANFLSVRLRACEREAELTRQLANEQQRSMMESWRREEGLAKQASSLSRTNRLDANKHQLDEVIETALRKATASHDK